MMRHNINEQQAANAGMLTKVMFRLLPIQILLAAIGAVNGIVSSLFASNYVGVNAMSAVALYNPLNLLIEAVASLLVGGSVIICGTYMGKNAKEKMQGVFSLDIVLSCIAAAIFTILLLAMGVFGLTGLLTKDPVVTPLFRSYLIGQAIGVFPMLLSRQLSAFLSLENRMRRTTTASIVYIIVNIGLNFLFVGVFQMEALGLALASSLGMWIFFGIQAQYFLTEKATLHFSLKHIVMKETGGILRIGIPGAMNTGYQTIRGLIVNYLLGIYVGSAGLSAFGASNSLLGIAWAVPAGMLTVSRLLISVSAGEEDRQTLTDVMRVMFKRFLPLMCVISACIILFAEPLTHMYYRDMREPIYGMTLLGFRILPLCMPLSVISMHFVCYGQVSGKQLLIHIISALDGFISVSFFSFLLIRFMGIGSVYTANVLNGLVSLLVIILYACIKNGHFPKNMSQLMVIPVDFGVPASERMDLTIRSMEEVVSISERVQAFCLERGIDQKRAMLAALAMEEMAGNVVAHGFVKDNRKHTVDIRVVHKNDDVILRIKDDCVPFDPAQRNALTDPADVTKNIGLRMVFGMAAKVEYQSILGMNVLTIHSRA